MARPRKYNVSIAGLSCYTDARTKKVYWRYKHPVTGRFHGLGTDETAAKEIAIEANSRLAENQMANMLRAREQIAKSSGRMNEVGTRDIASIIDEYVTRCMPRMAQLTRSVLIDVFREAQHAGEVPPCYNPALATKNPKARVNRQRLSLEEWHVIYAEAEKMQPWVSRAMLLTRS